MSRHQRCQDDPGPRIALSRETAVLRQIVRHLDTETHNLDLMAAHFKEQGMPACATWVRELKTLVATYRAVKQDRSPTASTENPGDPS